MTLRRENDWTLNNWTKRINALCGIFENNDRSIFLLLIQKLLIRISKSQLIPKSSQDVEPNAPARHPQIQIINSKHPKIWHFVKLFNLFHFLTFWLIVFPRFFNISVFLERIHRFSKFKMIFNLLFNYFRSSLCSTTYSDSDLLDALR